MRALMIFIAGLWLSVDATAGNQPPTAPALSADAVVELAKRVEGYAAGLGSQAFIIARQGRPDSDMPEGVSYTHTAVAIYSTIELSSGEQVNGYAIHNLYQLTDNAGRSQLVVDYPVDFFWGAATAKAGVIIPTVALEDKLLRLVANNQHTQLHNPAYSVIANPFNSHKQNCTEFTLDMINAAIYQTTDISRLKANTQQYFTPQRLSISKAKLFMGSLISDGVSLSDHSGKPATATFTSLLTYLKQYGLVEQAVTITGNTITPII